MFTYLINEEERTFENRVDLIAALEEAQALGYSVEDITDKKKKPKKEKEKEKDPILESIKKDAPKEDFPQGPAERADALAQTAAPDDAESLLATSSSASREEDLRQPEPEPDSIFAPEPKFIQDPIEIGNIQGEINQIETS